MLAAAASWMESLGAPMREIHKRYTKSEMAIMAWRSQESAANMRKTRHDTPQTDRRNNVTSINQKTRRAYGETDLELSQLEERLGPVAERLDESLDLRKLTGPEVHRFLSAQGMFVPMMGPRIKG